MNITELLSINTIKLELTSKTNSPIAPRSQTENFGRE